MLQPGEVHSQEQPNAWAFILGETITRGFGALGLVGLLMPRLRKQGDVAELSQKGWKEVEGELQRSLEPQQQQQQRGCRASSWHCPHILLSPSCHVRAGRMFYRGGVCCGKTPAAQAMEYKMMARNPSSGSSAWVPGTARNAPNLWGYPSSGNVELPAKVAVPVQGYSSLKAQLPCVSAAIASSSSLQPQRGCSVTGCLHY